MIDGEFEEGDYETDLINGNTSSTYHSRSVLVRRNLVTVSKDIPMLQLIVIEYDQEKWKVN